MADAAINLRERLRRRALELGFCRVGFAAPAQLPRANLLHRWLDRGMHGAMSYLARLPRDDPRRLLPEARTMIVVVARYASATEQAAGIDGWGRIARYARGRDYHQVVRARLERLAERITACAGPVRWRAAVDTAPLLEREAAVAAGVGFVGKNALLITPGVGSFSVIGELLVDLELPPDPPLRPRCGTCQRCIDACPTGALVAPRQVDARRCISYLTIEHRGPIDARLWGKTGDWVFGCDRCQEACPHNAATSRRLALPRDPQLDPSDAPGAVRLADLLTMRAGAYRRLTRGRALNRAPARAWRRNAALAALALAEHRPSAVDLVLLEALRVASEDRDEAVRQLARRAVALRSGSDR